MLLKVPAGLRGGLLAAALLASCRPALPWRNEPIGEEINLAFTVENNLLFPTTVRINGQHGRFFVGSAHAKSVLAPAFAKGLGGGRLRLQISEKDSIAFSPVTLDLGAVGDAIIGVDAWGSHALTIDFKSGLITLQKQGIRPGLMSVYSFSAEPAVTVIVDGETRSAIVDTASPDTLTLPAKGAERRGMARVVVAGEDFGQVDVRYAGIAQARIGNRLLSKFLVTIDYGRREVGLWRDPRIPIDTN